MSDHPDEPNVLAIEHETRPPEAPPAPPRVETPSTTSLVAWIALVVALAEAVALAVVWTHPALPPTLAERLSNLDAAAGAASSRASQAADSAASLGGKLDVVNAAIAELQRRPTPPPPSPPFDPGPLQSRIDELKSALDQARSETGQAAALAAAAQKAGQADQAALDTQAAKLATLSNSLEALATRLDKEGAAGRQVASLASSAERLARLQAASVALSIGRPTGPVPNAPPALARFSDAAPPTEASLILAFPEAAEATLKASEPDTDGQGFLKRIWIRAQSAVTVRDGSRVLVGDPAAGIVAAARERLAAGDLDGAVATLGALSGPAADTMDPWRSKAASLVDARAALATMMAHQ